MPTGGQDEVEPDRSRLRSIVEDWKIRPLTSTRMAFTGAGMLLVAVPFSLWFLAVGPTAGDRLIALGFLAVSLGLAVYSLWDAKAEDTPRRGDRQDPRT